MCHCRHTPTSSKYHITLFKEPYHPLHSTIQPSSKYHTYRELIQKDIRVYSSSSTFCVCLPLKSSQDTSVTNVKSLSPDSSSSLRFRCRRIRMRFGTLRTPCDQMNLFNVASMRTSSVFINLVAKLLISLMERGARFLN